MKIFELSTGIKKQVIVSEVCDDDFKVLTKKRFAFNWYAIRETSQLFKLTVEGATDIVGVVSLFDIPAECRVEIKLLACSIENRGSDKVYDGIAGCLIAYTCRIAKMKYGDIACVSLVPKTQLKQHYIMKYNMIDAGWQLFLEGKVLNAILLKYLL